MKTNCDFCGAIINIDDLRCANCGAENSHYINQDSGAPRTIEQFKKWYKDQKLPDEKITRFFIGKDVREAKAYGIYKDEATANFVVYKNNSEGVRSVRYEGGDEAYAVNELYVKLREVMASHKR